jgi:hypothetical protein
MSDKLSKKQEKEIAKNLHGGERVVASGALPWWKRDVISDNFLMEVKYTEAKSHSIKKDDLKQLQFEAAMKSKIGAYLVEFLPESEKYVLIKYQDFLAFDEYLSEEDD